LIAVLVPMIAVGLPALAEVPAGADEAPEQIYGRQKERDAMVATQMKGPGRTTITDPAVLKAMRKVPRHLFIPPGRRMFAYRDSPVPIGYGQTISQPYIVALMTQVLGLQPGMKVLEVGTGSGYQAAILAEITPHVFSMEIIDPLYSAAKDRLEKMGYESITLLNGDGYYGMEDHAPFDRIIVTCAALHIPPPLFKQLKPSGRMIIPVGGRYEIQRLLLVRKGKDGKRRSRSLGPVRFVPLVTGTNRDGDR